MSDWRNRLKLKEPSGRFHHFFFFSGLHLHPRRHCEKLPPAKDEKISAFVWKRLQRRADCFKEVLEGVCVFDVHILPPAEPRMNNDPAHIWLRDRASGPWAACSRPTDDWWPAGGTETCSAYQPKQTFYKEKWFTVYTPAKSLQQGCLIKLINNMVREEKTVNCINFWVVLTSQVTAIWVLGDACGPRVSGSGLMRPILMRKAFTSFSKKL